MTRSSPYSVLTYSDLSCILNSFLTTLSTFAYSVTTDSDLSCTLNPARFYDLLDSSALTPALLSVPTDYVLFALDLSLALLRLVCQLTLFYCA